MELNILSTVEGYLKRKLERADPLRLFLLGVEAIIIQQRLLIDKSAKMNLLAFAENGYLDHIGALVGVERLPATAATTTLRLSLSAPRETATIIPAGTRATPDGAVYFALDTDAVINAGELSTDAAATCTEVGEIGNGFIAGEINRIVDPVPFFSAVVNITKSEGGADIEGDENKNLEAYAKTGSKEYQKMVNEIARRLGLTSVKFATIEDLIESIGLPKDRVCTHCFDGSSYCHEHDND